MRVLSLFSGIGGFDLGFQKNGFEIIWANDFDIYAVQTYKQNFNNPIIYGDINQIDIKSIPNFDILIGGFPCQPFSMMGEKKGFEEARGTLFFRIAEIIKSKINSHNKPKAIVLENVKALKTHNNGKTFQTIREILENDLGYKFYSKVLNSADFGVPQTRNRTFIVCFANYNANFNFPNPITSNIKLQDILEEKVLDKYYLSNKIKKTILSNGSGGYQSKAEINLQIARPLCATMAKMHRASQDNYVSASKLHLSQIRDINKEKIRRLTPRECARLQGFPETFNIQGISDSQLYKQFGNAVTVTVSDAIAKKVKTTLENLGEWK